MALTTESYEPLDRQVNPRCHEWQTAHYIGADTVQAVIGNCELGKVFNNVAVGGGTVAFHDAIATDSLSAANRIVLVHLDNAGIEVNTTPFSLRKGLRIVTSSAATDITFQLRGRPTVSPRTFKS